MAGENPVLSSIPHQAFANQPRSHLIQGAEGPALSARRTAMLRSERLVEAPASRERVS